MPLNICHFASAFKLLLKLVIHYQNTGNKKRFFLFAKSLIIIANVSLEFLRLKEEYIISLDLSKVAAFNS